MAGTLSSWADGLSGLFAQSNVHDYWNTNSITYNEDGSMTVNITGDGNATGWMFNAVDLSTYRSMTIEFSEATTKNISLRFLKAAAKSVTKVQNNTETTSTTDVLYKEIASGTTTATIDLTDDQFIYDDHGTYSTSLDPTDIKGIYFWAWAGNFSFTVKSITFKAKDNTVYTNEKIRDFKVGDSEFTPWDEKYAKDADNNACQINLAGDASNDDGHFGNVQWRNLNLDLTTAKSLVFKAKIKCNGYKDDSKGRDLSVALIDNNGVTYHAQHFYPTKDEQEYSFTADLTGTLTGTKKVDNKDTDATLDKANITILQIWSFDPVYVTIEDLYLLDGDAYVRTNTEAGKLGTVCLPAATTVENATLYTVTGKEETNGKVSAIILTPVEGTKTEAGKPYIFKATEASEVKFRKDLSSEAAAEPVANGALVGNFEATTAPQGENYYVLSSSKFYYVDSNVSLAENRAYVDLSKLTEASAKANSISIAVENATVTAIKGISVAEEKNAPAFNLAGQRVAKSYKGIVIRNGKKVIVK